MSYQFVQSRAVNLLEQSCTHWCSSFAFEAIDMNELVRTVISTVLEHTISNLYYESRTVVKLTLPRSDI